MGTAGSVGATFMSPACVRHCVPPFFIRACENRRQRRGDMNVARVRALLRCAVFSSVHVGTAVSVGATFMSPAWVRCCAACVPSCLVGVCFSASVPGVINGAPTGYIAVRSWWPAVFSFVRVGTAGQRRGDIHVARVRAPLRPAVFSSVHVDTAGSVGATFMSPASVRCCVPPFFHPCMWELPAA